MNDEHILSLGHSASMGGYCQQWSQLINARPYDQSVYPTYRTLLKEMLNVLAVGAEILENPDWVRAVGNFRVAHQENLKRYTADLWWLRDRLPCLGYTEIKRAVLRERHETIPS